MDLKIDDLLEKQKDGVALLDLEYVSLNVQRVLALLTKYVAIARLWKVNIELTHTLLRLRTFVRK